MSSREQLARKQMSNLMSSHLISRTECESLECIRNWFKIVLITDTDFYASYLREFTCTLHSKLDSQVEVVCPSFKHTYFGGLSNWYQTIGFFTRIKIKRVDFYSQSSFVRKPLRIAVAIEEVRGITLE